MVYRDRMLTCEECGKTFFFTVTEQRQLALQMGTDEIETPRLCRQCRIGTSRAEQGAGAESGEWAPALREDRSIPSAVRGKPTPVEQQTARPQRARRPEPPVERQRETSLISEHPERSEGEEAFPLEEEGIELKLIGTVKWFSREKGYGFITKADGKDLFFHRADLAKDERSLPQEGEQVEFQIRQTEKGPEAFNVSVLPAE